jgi:type VI secretion system protein ImpH
MSTFGWQQDNSVANWLYAQPWDFDFFQGALLLEQLQPSRSAAGEGMSPDDEAVRFRSDISHVFAASELQALQPAPSSDDPPTLTANLLGLGGISGPLPDAYSDMLIESSWRKNFAMRDFLDIFHHRLLSLMVRARKAHHPSFTPVGPHDGPISRYLYAFLGMALDETRNRMQAPDRGLIYYSGILSQQPRSASGLERLLADYFQVPARVNQLLGQWRELEPSTWTRIGLGGANHALGHTAVLGTRIWDQQGRFEVALGPLGLASFLEFLPRGNGFKPLCELTGFYAGREFEFGFRLTLRAQEVPPARLGQSFLGWTSWLIARPLPMDDSQVRLRCHRPGESSSAFPKAR